MDKAYVGTMKLGERTPSQDADTAPDATFPWEGIADDELRDAAAKLVGDLKQARLVPPVVTPVPIRQRSRGERRSLRTLPGGYLRPPLAFNTRPRRLSTPPDAFELHPDVCRLARETTLSCLRCTARSR